MSSPDAPRMVFYSRDKDACKKKVCYQKGSEIVKTLQQNVSNRSDCCDEGFSVGSDDAGGDSGLLVVIAATTSIYHSHKTTTPINTPLTTTTTTATTTATDLATYSRGNLGTRQNYW